MAKDRHRIGYTFWLDLLKPQEENLSDEIELLKNKRSFASTIRDGIRLILSLREGRVDVLLELFPFVREKLQPPPMSGNDDLKKELAWIKELMLSQYKGDGGIKMASVGQGPKPLIMNTAPITAYDDDDELVIRKDKGSGERAAQNLINSMMALNGEQPMFKT